MKKTLVVGVVIFSIMLIMLGGAFSSAIAEGDEVSLSVSGKVWSRYLGSDGVVYLDKPVFQTDIFVSLNAGYYIDIWHSAGLDDADLSSNFGDELDLTFGRGFNWKGYGVDIGIIYIDGLPTFHMKEGDFVEPFVELNKGFDDIIADGHLFTPFLRLELLFPLNDGNDIADIFVGIKYNWQLSNRFSFGSKVYFLYDDAIGNSPTKVFIGGYEADLGWSIINEGITFNPLMFKVRTPLNSVSATDNRKTEAVIGVGFVFCF